MGLQKKSHLNKKSDGTMELVTTNIETISGQTELNHKFVRLMEVTEGYNRQIQVLEQKRQEILDEVELIKEAMAK